MLQELQDTVYRGFGGKKVMVIGDLMLDQYLLGQVKRVSPEAPVPILNVKEEKHTLGGAGNVALNLNGLGISVFLLGIIGSDMEGGRIKKLLSDVGLSSDHTISTATKPTTTKTRIVGEKQQIVRIDKENAESISEDLEALLVENFEKVIRANDIDAIIISDYAKGIITDNLCRFIIREANKKNLPIVIDPKGDDYAKYKNATIIMPNENELSLVCKKAFKTEKELKSSARQMYEKLNIGYLVVTRGEKGVSLIAENYEHDIPARALDVYDVSGAGDTIIALVTAGLVSELPIEESLTLANLAAGYVVSKFGTHPITYSELVDVINRELLSDQKLFNEREIENCLNYWENSNQKIVFTNGCFDIIHPGHIHLLRKAKQEGDKLIVGINSDESVKKLKGENRPVNKLEDRVKVLEALSFVDAIIPFNDLTPLELIRLIEPDILVKGADYEEDEIVGAQEVKKNGGRVVRVPLIEGKSTTELIKQVSTNNG